MTGTVVCGIDASEESASAARMADWLAGALDARPLAIHVTDGRPADALVSAARRTHAELIAVGCRGRGAIRSAVAGSTSLDTMRECGCPLLVVPPGAVVAPERARSLVCGIDGADESIAAARVARSLSRRLELSLVLVHVQPPSPPVALRSRGIRPPADLGRELERRREKALGRLSAVRRAARLPDATRERLERGAIASRIDAAAQEEDAALIVVGARAVRPWEAALVGSLSRTLARTASRPVLIVKGEERTAK